MTPEQEQLLEAVKDHLTAEPLPPPPLGEDWEHILQRLNELP